MRMVGVVAALLLLVALGVLWSAPDQARVELPASVRAELPLEEGVAAASRPAATEVVQPPGRSQAGPVWSVRGRVLASDSRSPLAIATVTADSPTHSVNRAATAADGTFGLTTHAGLPHQLLVCAPGHVPKRIDVPRPKADEREVEVGDVVLDSGWRPLIRVVDGRDGSPVAGAPVWLATDGHEPPSELGSTGSDGTLSPDDGLPATAIEETRVLLAASQDANGFVELLLPQGAGVRAFQVTLLPEATVEVRVQDQMAQPVAGAEVRLEPQFPPLRGLRLPEPIRARWSARTDRDGLARVRGIAAPQATGASTLGWGVSVRGDDFGPVASRPDQSLLPGGLATVTIQVQRQRLIRLVGTILDEQGQAIPPANVHVDAQSDGPTWRGPRFTIERLRLRRSDQVTVRVLARGYVPQSRTVTVPPAVVEHAEDFVLVRAAKLSGVALDAAGTPVRDVTLKLGHANQVTDQAGAFSFDVAAESEWEMAVVRLPEARPWLRPPPIRGRGAGSDVRVLLALDSHPGARLEVTLWREDGAVAEMPERVSLARQEEQAFRPVVTPGVRSLPGRLEADGLRPGDWLVSFHVASDYSGSLAERFTVRAGEDVVRLRIKVPSGTGTIVGEVLVDGLAPELVPPLVTVRLSPPSGEQVADGPFPVRRARGHAVVRPLRQRTFRIEGVAADREVTLTMGSDAEMVFARATVTVPRGGTTRVVLQAQAAGTVRFRSAEPGPEGMVQLLAQEPGAWVPPHRLFRAAGPIDFEVPFCMPGSHRWLFCIDSMDRLQRLLAVPVEFTVVSGQRTEVRVPIAK